MTKQYLDKNGLTYFWGKVKDNIPVKVLPLVYGYDEVNQEGYYYNQVVNVDDSPGTGIPSGVYVVDTSICTETYQGGIWFYFGKGGASQYVDYQLNHGDIIIATHASDSIYSVDDQLTVIQNGNISRALVTAVSVHANPRTTLSITNTVTDQTMSNYIAKIHHITSSSDTNPTHLFTHELNVNDVSLTLSLYNETTSTSTSYTFPVGTMFFCECASGSAKGWILTPDGDFYKVTGYSVAQLFGYKINNSPDMSNYLAKDNTTAFTPTGDYQPATKKYVDDNAGSGGGFDPTTVTGYSQSTTNQFLSHDTNGNLIWTTLPVASQTTFGVVKAYTSNGVLYINTQ